MTLYDRIHELLEYDPAIGDFHWRIENRNYAKGVNACRKTSGYLYIDVDGKYFMAHRVAWLYVYGYMPELMLDHIDRVKDNNKIENLREVSCQCNMRNSGNPKNNTSGVRGVSFHNRDSKWVASVKVNGVLHGLCSRSDFVEAVCHRLAAEQALDWDGCDSSSPSYKYVQKYLRSVRGGVDYAG